MATATAGVLFKGGLSRGVGGTNVRDGALDARPRSSVAVGEAGLSERWRRFCDEGRRHSLEVGLTEDLIQEEIEKYYEERQIP